MSEPRLGSAVTPEVSARSGRVDYACTDLEGRLIVGDSAERPHYAASTMKLMVLAELFRQRDAGSLQLDERLVLPESFPSAVDGRPYRLEESDRDPELLGAVGERLSIGELAEGMITRSSNEATNVLIGRIGLESLQGTLSALGLGGSRLERPIGDRRAEEAGRRNIVTPLDLCRVLAAIGSGRAAGPDSTEVMLGYLRRQLSRDGIAAGLPPDVVTGSKDGWVEGVLHDAALVWPPHGPAYAMAICTEGFSDWGSARSAVRSLASRLHALVLEVRQAGAPDLGSSPR